MHAKLARVEAVEAKNNNKLRKSTIEKGKNMLTLIHVGNETTASKEQSDT